MRKQKKNKYLFIILYSILITLIYGALPVYASQTLPPGIVIGDNDGVYASSEGEYYVDLPNVLPGEKYTKVITIRSMDIKEPFESGLLVTPKSSKGTIQFDQKIKLTLKLDEKVLYQGPLMGNDTADWTVEPLILGVCTYGEDQILTAEFEVAKDLVVTDYEKESQLLYYWTFIATKNNPVPPISSDSSDNSSSSEQKEKSTGRFPMTGEEIKTLMYKILVGLLAILIIVLLWKKRKEEKSNSN